MTTKEDTTCTLRTIKRLFLDIFYSLGDSSALLDSYQLMHHFEELIDNILKQPLLEDEVKLIIIEKMLEQINEKCGKCIKLLDYHTVRVSPEDKETSNYC